jgi:preprotein translocase subunit YajC
MGAGGIQLLFPIALFAVFYLLLIRPQQKQQKQIKEMQTKLKKHDEIVTTGGIHGTVVNVKDRTITLRIDDNVRIEVDKNAVSQLVKEG